MVRDANASEAGRFSMQTRDLAEGCEGKIASLNAVNVWLGMQTRDLAEGHERENCILLAGNGSNPYLC